MLVYSIRNMFLKKSCACIYHVNPEPTLSFYYEFQKKVGSAAGRFFSFTVPITHSMILLIWFYNLGVSGDLEDFRSIFAILGV